MTDIRQILAVNMKKYRKMKGVSQAALAERIKTATNYIAMIETARKFPSPQMLARIAEALGIDTPELFTTGAVTFMPIYNKSRERLYQDIIDDFRQFEKTVVGRIRDL